ncbi:unnamed protein product, partial [Meganyctiphanes norvegica]
MFWILKKPKFKLNFFSNIRKNNVANTDPSQSKRGYDRLPQQGTSAYSPVVQQQRVHGRGLTPPKLTLTCGDNDEVTSFDSPESPSTEEWQEDDVGTQHGGNGHCTQTTKKEDE